MNEPHIPLLDLSVWRTGDDAIRKELALELDHALRTSGFLLLSGHQVPAEMFTELRRSAKQFFSLPTEAKNGYATTVGGRGWIPTGKEANSFLGVDADVSRPDMKETYTVGRDHLTGDAKVDATWFRPNVWPKEVPDLQHNALRFMDAMCHVYDDLLQICALALGLDAQWFIERTSQGTRTLNINRYPSLQESGAAQEGQFRVGPHTDWGIFTLLDRQPGYGGLQIESDGAWFDAPFVEGALVINIGDLMARWTGDRWRSTRHRVLPPQPDMPQEELISLIQFCDANVGTLIEPIGRDTAEPAVTAGEYMRQRALAATVN
ncbi:isopenicillin N synthase family dioxygenase [Streptomyces sp. NBC_00483]|uniref:isopenicillin N synthase family dioxygenase n=1 Tax=Streptomyces sp. NBC_00483 TaxID=2975756 RepID=UPI002E18C332